jgi:hypothetical protein
MFCRQNPQCEGHYKHRILFNAKALSHRRIPFNVRKEGDKYVISGGTARGIDIGDEFTLYRKLDSTQKSSPLGTFVVSAAGPFESTIKPLRIVRFKDFESALALQTRVGTQQDLRVYIPENKTLTKLFNPLDKEFLPPDRPRILRVGKEEAELGIEMNNQRVVFEVLDKHVTKFGLRRIPFSIKADMGALSYILDSAARFHWHLRRTDRDESIKLSDHVQLELREVVKREANLDDLTWVVEPVGNNLVHDGVINVVEDPKTMYGIKIQNDSALPLYAALFYFNVNDLSIGGYLLFGVDLN